MKEQIDQMIENWLFNTLGAENNGEDVERQTLDERFEAFNGWDN